MPFTGQRVPPPPIPIAPYRTPAAYAPPRRPPCAFCSAGLLPPLRAFLRRSRLQVTASPPPRAISLPLIGHGCAGCRHISPAHGHLRPCTQGSRKSRIRSHASPTRPSRRYEPVAPHRQRSRNDAACPTADAGLTSHASVASCSSPRAVARTGAAGQTYARLICGIPTACTPCPVAGSPRGDPAAKWLAKSRYKHALRTSPHLRSSCAGAAFLHTRPGPPPWSLRNFPRSRSVRHGRLARPSSWPSCPVPAWCDSAGDCLGNQSSRRHASGGSLGQEGGTDSTNVTRPSDALGPTSREAAQRGCSHF